MFTLALLLYRKPGTTTEQYQNYWHDVHGPIAAKIPGLRGYVQKHVQPDAEGNVPVDGIAELTFDSADAQQAGFASPEGKAALDDVANFADTSRVVAFPVEVRRIV
ncbi:EthD family reductase [Skermanella sp. TT6]|uniref:EthD family reductase n=1 Tax=Skermanella cutis TaxID=2775420 RepID=A0ABX7B2R0_9PROT|nr:EthD family reductase [Skermanella sp. TT6]QQP88615.1 EthD family reductase [Skermanella sp. TT6]